GERRPDHARLPDVSQRGRGGARVGGAAQTARARAVGCGAGARSHRDAGGGAMSSIGLPLPLLDVGLRPQPFVAPDADVAALGGLGDDTLADLFRELLFELHECFELLIWTGREIDSVQIVRFVGGIAADPRARIAIATMAI